MGMQVNDAKGPGAVEYFQCSAGQQALWFEQSIAPDSAAYHVALSAEIDGPFDEDRFIRALQTCVERHSLLRCSFHYAEGKVSYSVSSQNHPIVERIALTSDFNGQIHERLSSAYHSPFDLKKGPLVRLHIASAPSGRKFILIVMHHLICDAWSLRVIFEHIARYYDGDGVDEARPGLPSASSFEEYVKDQYLDAEGQRWQKARSYWKHALAGCNGILPLTTDFVRPMRRRLRGSTLTFELSKDIYDGVIALSRNIGVTPYTVFLTAYGFLLSAYGDAGDFCIGSPVMARLKKEHLGTVGYCMNPVLIRMTIDNGDTVGESLKKSFAIVQASLSHQDYPFPFVINDCGLKRVPGHATGFQVLFNFMNKRVLGPLADLLYGNDGGDGVSFGGLRMKPFPINQQEGQCDCALDIVDTGKTVRGALKYDDALFTGVTASAMSRLFPALLETMRAGPGESVGNVIDASLKRASVYNITIGASFTIEPIREHMAYWNRLAQQPGIMRFAPFGRMLDELVSERGIFQRNLFGYNVLFVRPEDFCPPAGRDGRAAVLKENLQQLRSVVDSAVKRSRVPIILVLAPPRESEAYAADDVDVLRSFFEGSGSLPVITAEDILKLHPVASLHLPVSDAAEAIPYSRAFYFAAAAAVTRKAFSLRNKPCKVIAVDCDNTLWDGVVAEEGIEGIRIRPEHEWLQRFLVEQHRSGKLICLISKNNEDDVLEVFQKRSDMVLKLEQCVGYKINWQPKADNIMELSAELSLDLESFLFIDDNPVECSEMAVLRPKVTVLELPREASQWQHYFEHYWFFDSPVTTSEDASRTVYYRENALRNRMESAAPSFADFFTGLSLEITVEDAGTRHLERISQLSFRTNQFNFTGKKYAVPDLERALGGRAAIILSVSARDRFGDYGEVGALLAEITGAVAEVELFLVSCRALGRGIEHAMVRHLGERLASRGVASARFTLYQTARNRPAFDFFKIVAPTPEMTAPGTYTALIAAGSLTSVRFEPSLIKSDKTVERPTAGQEPAVVAYGNKSAAFHAIASAAAVIDTNDQPVLPLPAGAPSDQKTAAALRRVWQELLRHGDFSDHDNFFDRGGTSLMLPEMTAHLSAGYGIEVSLIDLFRYPSIGALCDFIGRREEPGTPGNLSTRTKARQQMRALRDQAMKRKLKQKDRV